MKTVRTAFVITALTCLSSPLLADTVAEGRWETTQEMQSPMGGFNQPAEVVCIDRPVDPEQEMLSSLNNEQGCQITKSERDGDALHFTATCIGGDVKIIQQGTLRYDDDNYAMDIEMITDATNQPMMAQAAGADGKIHSHMKIRAHRLGDCDGSEPKFDEQSDVEPKITFTPGSAEGGPMAECIQLSMEMTDCIGNAMNTGSEAAIQSRMEACQSQYKERMQACEALGTE